MLAKTARLTESGDFARATKSGLRSSSSHFVGYLHIESESTHPSRVGLIIGKNIGGSVLRHRLARTIRHYLREHYSKLPVGSLLVIRALTNAGQADYAQELNLILTSLVKKAKERAMKK